MIKFKILFLEQLLTLRSSLPFLIFMQTVVPVSFVFAMGHYAGFRSDNQQLLHIISGSITFSLIFLGLSSLAAKISFMRQQGTLLHYISLPINKFTFIAALLSARLVLLLPGIIAPVIAGMLMYGLDFQLSLWLLTVMALGIFTLAVAGVALGAYIKSYELVSVVTGCLIFIMSLVAPTFMPPSVLPLPLQLLGWLLPSTYISNALNRSLTGSYEATFYLDVLVLGLMAGVALLVTKFFLVWRAD